MYFSVIIPFRNEENYIGECLNALVEQDFDRSEYELIFINNGSTDKSENIVQEYSAEHLLSYSKPDPYLSRNFGASYAQGKYLIFLDADCKPQKNWLSVFYQTLQQNSSQMLLGKLEYPQKNSLLLKGCEDYYDAKTYLMQSMLPPECAYGHAGNMVIEKNLFDSLGGFHPMPVAGDTEIVQRYLQTSPSACVQYIPDAVVKHLEIKSFFEMLIKQKNYGKLSYLYARQSEYRVLSLREKFTVARFCVQQNNYRYVKSFMLFLGLGLGLAAFEYGRIHALLFPGPVPR